MNNDEVKVVQPEVLNQVLSKILRKPIIRADHQLSSLQGGTIGNVQLVTGMAETSEGDCLPYKVVWKVQRKFERYSDPDSWRREYDLYTSGFDQLFTASFRWPACYHAEIHDNEIHLWMEHIDGVTGSGLNADMMERLAEELGRFQGRLYAERPAILQQLPNLSQVDYMKNNYLHYRSWPEVHDYIRSEDCDIPKHLCEMLIGIDQQSDEIFDRLAQLPIVLCHRDYWVANLFHSNSGFVVIDWDTAGWGYLGEDIASLIADEADVPHMVAYYQRCVPAYYRGFSDYADVSPIVDSCITELILLMFGYRLVEWVKFAESPEDRSPHLNTLQRIYEMRQL